MTQRRSMLLMAWVALPLNSYQHSKGLVMRAVFTLCRSVNVKAGTTFYIPKTAASMSASQTMNLNMTGRYLIYQLKTKKGEKMLEELNKAKENVKWLLDHEAGLVDMHGLVYWSQVVERLRKQIKETL